MEEIYTENYVEGEKIIIGGNICDNNIIYNIEEELGTGAFADVYECKTSVGRKVAIKIINKIRLIGYKFENKKLIQNEIDVHSKLKHNKIINFEKFFQDDTNIYIVLELSKYSLYNMVYKNNKNIDINDIIRIIRKIVNGLMYLKENFIIHRDIKVENILINDEDDIKISDFGLSVKLDNIDDTCNKSSGTIYYMSPQVVQEQEYSFETDVWSLGVLFYELLFKTTPFEKEDSNRAIIRKIVACKFNYPDNFDNEIIKDIINEMLKIDRNERISLEDLYFNLDISL